MSDTDDLVTRLTAPGADLASRRAAWTAARDAALAGGAGPLAARALSDLADRLMAALCAAAAADADAGEGAPATALVALGGYGRRELLPRSDIDLCLLSGAELPDATVEAVAAAVFTPLWDLGLRVGHSVRSVAGALDALRRDPTAATALLEGRFVAGDRTLFETLRRRVCDETMASWIGPFLEAKLAETRTRHEARGGTPFLNEPDLKEGRGYLRDHQLARLLAALGAKESGSRGAAAEGGDDYLLMTLPATTPGTEGGFDPFVASGLLREDDARRLAAASALLLAARTCVHAIASADPTATGRAERLDLYVQPEVARRMGYEDGEGLTAAERMMREVYRSARLVDTALRLALAAVAARRAGRPTRSRSVQRRALPGGLVVVGRELFFASDPARPSRIATARPAEGAGVSPARALDAFLTAQRLGLELAPSALEKIRRGLDGLDDGFRRSEPAARSFRELLGGHAVATTLRAMHASGFLGEYLPELGDLDGLVQSDGYHAYTVDEHTLRALAALEEAPAPVAAPTPGRLDADAASMLGASRPEREDQLRREVFGRVGQRDLLRLALLVHDTGKVGGAEGHVERGVARIGPMARRLHLELAEERRVSFLVEAHLQLSELATKRDIESPETVAELAAICRGSIERLDLLYLLTCADVRATGTGAFTRWKDALITRLYERTRAELVAQAEGTAPPRPATADEVVAQLRPVLPAGVQEADLVRHLQRIKRPYLLETEPAEVLLHVELIASLEREKSPDGPRLALTWELDDGFEHVWVATEDRPALFARLAGGLSAQGMNILGGRAFTRTDGLVIDRFVVRANERERVNDPAFWEELEQRLRAAVSGAADLAEQIARRARRVGEAPSGPRRRTSPVRVLVTNKASPRYTVVEVSAEDRPGLLYDLTRAMARLDLDLHTARIATRAHRAEDVFYLTRDGRKVTGEKELAALRREVAAAAEGADGE